MWNNGAGIGGMCCEGKMDVAVCGKWSFALADIPVTGCEPFGFYLRKSSTLQGYEFLFIAL
jgi:hypothetical protein